MGMIKDLLDGVGKAGILGLGADAGLRAADSIAENENARNLGLAGLIGLKKGGKVNSASSRADGIAQRGKTRGTIIACGGGYMKGKK